MSGRPPGLTLFPYTPLFRSLDAATLVRSGELFGIAEGTTRVALSRMVAAGELVAVERGYQLAGALTSRQARQDLSRAAAPDRKSTRLNSSHANISYAVFCLK